MDNDSINKIAKLHFDTVTLDSFCEFIDKNDFYYTDNFASFMKYFYYYLNEKGLKDCIAGLYQGEFFESYWNQINTSIDKNYWDLLVDGTYFPIFVNITKENIQIICDATKKLGDAQHIAPLLKICSNLLMDEEWGLHSWVTWCDGCNLKKSKIESLWKKQLSNKERDSQPVLFYEKYIADRLMLINKDNQCKVVKLHELKNIISPKKLHNENVKIQDLSDDELILFKLLENCRDQDAAKVLYKLEGHNMVCINSKTCEYYIFNDYNKLWEHKTENLLMDIIANPLINLTERFISILEKSIHEADDTKFKSDREIMLKKIIKVRQELGKSPFIKKIIEWLRNNVYDNKFINKINKISHLLPINNNLVMNLRSGQSTIRLKTHYFTFSCNVSYGNHSDENGNIPDHMAEIKQFYLDIAGGNILLCKLYQVLFGLCLTGEMEKLIFIIYGKGNNGKSLMMRILKKILGSPFYETLNKAIFIEAKGNSSANAHTSYLQGIMESRVGVAGEVTENDKLHTALLKSISGCDSIKGRDCNGTKEYELEPRSKLIIPVNDIPSFPPKDPAFIDRLVIAPATTKFVDCVYEYYEYSEEIVQNIFSDIFPYNAEVYKKTESGQRYKNQVLSDNMEKNQEYLNDIFKWMVAGSVLYYKEGIFMPDCVIEAKKQCIQNNDKLQQFLMETLTEDPKDSDIINYIKVKDLLYLYQEGGRINISPNEVTKFCKELRQRNYKVEPKGKTGEDRMQYLWHHSIDDLNDSTLIPSIDRFT